jgi:hypothetical protein
MAVAEKSHFDRARSRLGTTQPPPSPRIQRLERELGVRLFDRPGRDVSLTWTGTLLLHDARGDRPGGGAATEFQLAAHLVHPEGGAARPAMTGLQLLWLRC